MMFWLGFIAGIAATFVALFVWFTRGGDPFDDMSDECADGHGVGGAADTHFGTGQ